MTEGYENTSVSHFAFFRRQNGQFKIDYNLLYRSLPTTKTLNWISRRYLIFLTTIKSLN